MTAGPAKPMFSPVGVILAAGLGILPLTILLNVSGDSTLTMKAWNWDWLLLAALAVFGWVLARRHSEADRGA